MVKTRFKRYTAKGLKNALLIGAGVGMLGGAATAQIANPDAPLKLRTDYFGYAASVSPRVTYTDNINLADDGSKDNDVILSTLFTGGAIVSTPRVTALMLGDLDFSYLTEAGDFVVNQNVGAASTFTLADNWLYVDASGQTSRQLLGDNARFSGNLNAARNQRANVHSFTASPYIYHRMPDQSAVELRYRYSRVFIDDDNASANLLGNDFLNDSTSHEAVASYESGGAFERFRFRLVAYGNQTDETGSDQLPVFEYDQGSLLGEAQFALSRSFFLSGAVGYDEVDTKSATSLFFNDDMLSGVFWRAGFSARPGRRSRIRVEYGERYGDDFIDADAFYEISQRLIFTAGASREFRSRAQGVNAQFRGAQSQTLDFADRLREGQEISPRSVIEAANSFANVIAGRAAQTAGVSISDNAFAALSAVYDRTQVTMRASYADDDFGFRQIESFNGALTVRHRMSRRLNAYGSVDFRRADTSVDAASCQANPFLFGLNPFAPGFDLIADCADVAANNGVTNTVIGRVGAAYQLYKNVSIFGEYSHAERFSEVAALEYGENAATAGFTLEF